MTESETIPQLQKSRCKKQRSDDRKKWNLVSEQARNWVEVVYHNKPNGFHQNFKKSEMATYN